MNFDFFFSKTAGRAHVWPIKSQPAQRILNLESLSFHLIPHLSSRRMRQVCTKNTVFRDGRTSGLARVFFARPPVLKSVSKSQQTRCTFLQSADEVGMYQKTVPEVAILPPQGPSKVSPPCSFVYATSCSIHFWHSIPVGL